MDLVVQVFYGIFIFRIRSERKFISHVAILSQVFYDTTGGLVLVSNFYRFVVVQAYLRCVETAPLKVLVRYRLT